ncbi:hypothetical protein MVEN_02535700 [Mycena venus]|uniref:Uncharacterized protein n=1 Tax=Mycena venus TaxID=2733690 RepID=A0A8H6WTU8_9AGAR|nr:hypothetical protein MVEN_02535700 [Mycena venus]
MATSLALIPWDPEANKVVARIDENSRPDGGRWTLVLHALLHPSPGRTLDRVYTSLGKVVEKQANKAAYAFGLGPHVVAQKIKSYFGNGEERVQRLDLLRSTVPPQLEKKCFKLMKYTQPIESAETQCQAFKDVVHLVTLFPGLRVIFLCDKFLGGKTSADAISGLYNRDFVAVNAEWEFWRTLTTTCLSYSDIAVMVEGRRICELTVCDEGLGLVERLLIGRNSADTFQYSSAICVRYLGGVLALPGFWQDTGKIHSYVANRLCCEMVRLLKDIEVDVQTLGPIDESEPPFDYEGVDLLSTLILNGLLNWFSKLDKDDWGLQVWYESFKEFIQLLRRPRAAELLPGSSACATSSFEHILPTVHRDEDLNVLVNR